MGVHINRVKRDLSHWKRLYAHTSLLPWWPYRLGKKVFLPAFQGNRFFDNESVRSVQLGLFVTTQTECGCSRARNWIESIVNLWVSKEKVGENWREFCICTAAVYIQQLVKSFVLKEIAQCMSCCPTYLSHVLERRFQGHCQLFNACSLW